MSHADVDGGRIDGAVIGGITPAAATFTTSNQTTLKIGGTTVDATAAEITRACDLSARIVTLIATGAITEAAHESRTLLMTVAGASSTYTLPAATGGGARYRFVVGEVNTSNYVIKSVAGADVMQGTILGASVTDSATDAARTWRSGTTDDTITLNGTTTGGVDIGDWIELEDISATAWFVRGFVTQSGSEATMFSDSVA